MRGIGKIKMERRRIPIYLLLISVVMVGLLAFRWGMMSEAEGEVFEIGSTKIVNDGSFAMETQSITVTVLGLQPANNISWYVYDEQGNVGDNSVISIPASSTGSSVVVNAVKAGKAQLCAKVDGTSYQLNIEVSCKIDRSKLSLHSVEKDKEKALLLAVADDEEKIEPYVSMQKLTLSTGNEGQYQWSVGPSGIAEVQSVTAGAVMIKAKKSGKATIYVKNQNDEIDSIDVYVMPRISVGKQVSYPGYPEDPAYTNNTFAISSGAIIYTDAYVDPIGNINNCMSWSVLVQDKDGNNVEIANSKGLKSDRIKLIAGTNESGVDLNAYIVHAKAGRYILRMHPKTDNDEWNYSDNSNNDREVAPTTVTLNVLPDITSKDLTLSVGDEIDLLDLLNVQAIDLNNPVITIDGSQYNLDNDYFSIDGNYKLVAKNETGDQKVRVTIDSKLKDATGQPYKVELSVRIVDPVILNVSKVSVRVGGTMDLSKAISSIGNVTNGYKPEDYEWTLVNASDEAYATIDEKGVITGKQSTKGKQDHDYVEVKASLKLKSGVIKTATCRVQVSEAADSVEIIGPQSMSVGDSKTIEAKFKSNGNLVTPIEGAVRWEVSDPDIVSITNVDSRGTFASVTALKTGLATLTILNKDDNVVGIWQIRVEVELDSIEIARRGVSVSKQKVEVSLNQEYLNLTALVTDTMKNPVKESEVSLEWVGSNKAIVEIEDNSRGLIKLISAGEVRITVTYRNNPKIYDYITLVITADTKNIKLTKDKVSVNVGETIDAVPYQLEPATANPTLQWYSMDTNIATVDVNTGKITGKAVGSTNLLVVTSDGKKAECVIIVEQPTIAIKFIQPEITISKGSTLPLMDPKILQMTPADTTETPTWNSFEPGIASVDKSGVVTAVEAGTTYITAAIVNKNGELLTESIKIIVVDAPSGISIDKDEYIVDVADTIELTYQLTPSNATTNVTWRSLDESIAKVDEKTGVVTGVKVGWTYIVASSEDGCYDTCIVYVRKQATGVDIVKSEEEVEVGKTKQLLYSLAPDIEATGSLSWNSSDTSIATVDATGVVTGVKIGTTFIVVTGIDSTGKVYSDTCRIKVVQAATNIVLEQEVYTVEVKGTKQITYHFDPTPESTAELSWGVLDSTIATVDKEGVVTGVKIGSTYVYVNGIDPNGNIFSKSCRIDVVQMATGMKLESEKYTVEVGKTQQIGYTLTPNNDAYMALSWSVIDPKVATVDDKGVVTGVNVGTTHVIVTGLGVSATCTIEVFQSAETLTFTNPSITLDVGESAEAAYTLTPATATKQTLNWSSQNATIASVDANGKITGVSKGITTVFANLPNGNVSYLTVNVISKVKGIQLDPASTELVKGKTLKIKPVFTPTDATNKKVKWASSNESVATIDENGKVTAVAGGITMITGISEDGNFSGSSMITVTEAVTSVKLNHSSYKLVKGRSVTLKATVDSNTATNSKVKWTTSNKKIATVSQSGKVTGKNIGTCTIKVTAKDGSKRSASCKIRVIRVAKGLAINKTYLNVMEGRTAKLKTRFTPKNASIKRLKWETSDAAIATITSKGIITGVTPGTCTVTAKTTDGSNIKVSCTVNVYERVPSTGITVAVSDMIIVKGMTQSAGVTVSPANTTDKIRYSSDHKSIATVSSKGKIKAHRPGNATITVSVGNTQEAYISVTVVDLNKTSLTMEQYDADDLWVEGIDQNVKWSSSNPSVARVDNGTVVARRVGTCTITASLDGVKLQCRVRVNRLRRR